MEPWVQDIAMELYETEMFTLKDIGEMLGYCASAIYYCLKKKGCKFIRTGRHPMSEDARKRIGMAHRGKVISDAQRRAISERNSCNYNGLNGYGHTKEHNKGYILAYAPKHPNAHKDGYVMLHTVLMEQAIGRYLESDEVVHHINHNRTDNRLENLMLMKKKDHMSMHMKERHEKRRNDLRII